MEQKKDQVKQLAIVSGKGGTGKTTIAAAFAALAKGKVMVDCDVDTVMDYPCNEVQGTVQQMWDQVEAMLIQ